MAGPLSAAAPRKPHLAAGLVIATITVETHNVFDTSAPPENKLLYRAANRIHITTFDPVVRRELLFEVGDSYDPLLIEETERNLRALSFIRRAEIAATINGRGMVDVIVRTYDAWTLEVVASFKRAGEVTNVKAGLAEHNIVGQGKSGSAVYSRDGAAESKAFAYKDVQFLHYKRLQYSMVAIAAPGHQNFSVSLNRPFYASIARRSAGAAVSYGSSAAAEGVSRRVGEAGGTYGIAFATSTSRTRRVSFGLLTRRAQSTGAVPDLEQLTFLKAGVDWQELDFLTARRIQNFTRDEDFNLGLGIFPSVAWAPMVRALGTTQAQLIPRLDLSKGFTWSNQLLLLKSGYASKYVNGANGNAVASVDAAFYLRALRFQTLAFHAGLDLGWKLDSAHLLTLGELNGLRGYGLSEFSGNRRFLFNIEDRIYVWDDLFSLMDVGAVAFFDSGYAWAAADRLQGSDMKSSVGLGLRVAPSRSGSNSPVRIDVALPLNRASGRAAWSLSVLAGQAF
ncbi:MAG: BamA/TamA family outer membrane protein [Elusimicrobia bacterium]|nr:BamA/TamA family outer membrane protein [Elusimicrobiota bacterium]